MEDGKILPQEPAVPQYSKFEEKKKTVPSLLIF